MWMRAAACRIILGALFDALLDETPGARHLLSESDRHTCSRLADLRRARCSSRPQTSRIYGCKLSAVPSGAPSCSSLRQPLKGPLRVGHGRFHGGLCIITVRFTVQRTDNSGPPAARYGGKSRTVPILYCRVSNPTIAGAWWHDDGARGSRPAHRAYTTRRTSANRSTGS